MSSDYRPESILITNGITWKNSYGFSVYSNRLSAWRHRTNPPFHTETEGPHFNFSSTIIACLRTGFQRQKFQGESLGEIDMLVGYDAADLGSHTRKIQEAEILQVAKNGGVEIKITGITTKFENRTVNSLSYADIPLVFSMTLFVAEPDYEKFWKSAFATRDQLSVPAHWITPKR